MIRRSYDAQQRRAGNQVWNAAQEYGFEPLFMAFTAAGQPDFYMNCMVGFARRWCGDERIRALFASWAGDARQGTFDDIAWLALENALYEKELPRRPALEGLRRLHAEAFFADEYQLSRQQWMAKNQVVYTQQAARWHAVLDENSRLLNPWEKKLQAALCCSGTLDAAALDSTVRGILREFFLFDGNVRARGPFRIHFSERWVPLLTKLLPTEMVRTDELTVGRSSGEPQGSLVTAAKALRTTLRGNETPETDREYIENSFGRSLFAERELAAIEQQLCTGNHAGCHLWFTAGVPAAEKPRGESLRLADEAEQQYARNREIYRKNAELYRSVVAHLTEQVRNCLLLHQQPAEQQARLGRLDGGRVWRQPVLADSRVFCRRTDEAQPGFAVDLLLDASASRLHCQETIAAQGSILAESLCACGIPVRVESFCSLRGYTVLRILKDYRDKPNYQNLFRYFAAGWNRDGLALRAAGRLMEASPAEKHLLILLTDASPNDSHRIPPTGKVPLSRDYGGEAGTADAAAEAHALRQKGIRVAAVFMGENGSVPAARMIFGRDMVRIRRMDELAAAAGKLIESEIRELSL